ncbi:MAG: alpha/beta hydrolase [Burkholderiaceae bacterium]
MALSFPMYRKTAHAALCGILLVVAALGVGIPAQAQGLRAKLAERTQAAAPLPPGVQKIADVPYGPDARQRMDIYRPTTNPSGTRAPVIFMVHGGGWYTGDKAIGRVVDHKVARWVPRGLILVSVNYRLLPDTPVSQQVQDVAQALATAQQQAAQWGGDAGRFILMGHSAGAHLVSLINAQPALAQRLGAWPWLGTVSLDSAVLNVPQFMRAPHLPLYDDAFGTNPVYWHAMSPFHQWVSGAPPYQFVCSTERPDQPCLQAQAMAQHVQMQGGRAEVLPQPLTHGEINAELGLDSDYTRAVEGFMASLDLVVAQKLGR